MENIVATKQQGENYYKRQKVVKIITENEAFTLHSTCILTTNFNYNTHSLFKKNFYYDTHILFTNNSITTRIYCLQKIAIMTSTLC